LGLNAEPYGDLLLSKETRFAAFKAFAANRLGLLQTGSEPVEMAQVLLNSKVGL